MMKMATFITMEKMFQLKKTVIHVSVQQKVYHASMMSQLVAVNMKEKCIISQKTFQASVIKMEAASK